MLKIRFCLDHRTGQTTLLTVQADYEALTAHPRGGFPAMEQRTGGSYNQWLGSSHAMPLPSRQEINVHNSLDERSACDHFFGKTLDQAEALFRENSLYYQENLMWMGPKAFSFYVDAVIRYVQSEAASSDTDIFLSLINILEFRLEHERADMLPIAGKLGAFCDYIVQNHERFRLAAEYYGDFRPRFQALHAGFCGLLHHDGTA